MFGSKKKSRRVANRFVTGHALLKAAASGDQDAMAALATGHGTDDDGLWFALQTFLAVAHNYPPVINRLREIQPTMPSNAQTAFATGIQPAEVGRPSLFKGENVTGQGLFIFALATALSENDEAYINAMAALLPDAGQTTFRM